jgi:nucleoside-diphosphate-sugar epimerase
LSSRKRSRYEEAEGTTKSPANVEKARGLGWEPTWSLGEIVRDALAATSGDATVRRSA